MKSINTVYCKKITRNCSITEYREGVKPSPTVDTTDRQDFQPLSPPNTAVQHTEDPSAVPSNSSLSKESI